MRTFACVNDLPQLFPKLAQSPYRCIGTTTFQYNCIAWALGKTDRFWSPTPMPDPRFYWPPGFPQHFTIAVLVQIFESFGYKICDSGAFEYRYEKIALFGSGPVATHAARQLGSGKWSSKLGPQELIEHELEAVAGHSAQEYGEIVHFMRRRRTLMRTFWERISSLADSMLD